jgi:hypothetical protein
MSASAPRQMGLRNPATKFIKWKGARTQGYFYYYDKEIEDPKFRNVQLDLGEGFYILDKDLFSITGFIEPTKTSVMSNEVREITDTLIVKGWKDKKAEILLQGPYTTLKNVVKDSNIYNYTRSVYIMFRGELCHLELSGASFATWIKQVEANAAHVNSIVRHTGNIEKQKGIVEYQEPQWEVGEKADEETWNQVLQLDSTVLQPYLKEYFAKAGASPTAPAPGPDVNEEAFDIKNWRQYRLPSGSRMCELSSYQIREHLDRLIEVGDVDSVVYNCLSQACVEYNQAVKTWESKKDNAKRPLSDYTAEEVKALLDKVAPDHPIKLTLEAAYEAKTCDAPQAELEDDVPF